MGRELANGGPLGSPTGLSGSEKLWYAVHSRTAVRQCCGRVAIGPVWEVVCNGDGRQRTQSWVRGAGLAIVKPDLDPAVVYARTVTEI